MQVGAWSRGRAVGHHEIRVLSRPNQPVQGVDGKRGANLAPAQALTARGRGRMYIPSVSAKVRAMTRSTVFTTNRSQAVRLPKRVALPEGVRQVEIVKVGRSRLISPAGQSWDEFFDGPGASNDFMRERAQPEAPEREAL